MSISEGSRSASRSSPRTAATGERRRVLLADDDTQMRELLASTLRRKGYVVTACANGVNLLDHLGSYLLRDDGEEYDVVITDIRMPGVTGMEVLEGVSGNPGFPPIILITAFGDRETHEHARRLGAAAMFDKPFRLQDLTAVVERLAPPPMEGSEDAVLAAGTSAGDVLDDLAGLDPVKRRVLRDERYVGRRVPPEGWRVVARSRRKRGKRRRWWLTLIEEGSDAEILVQDREEWKVSRGDRLIVQGRVRAVDSRSVMLDSVTLRAAEKKQEMDLPGTRSDATARGKTTRI